MKKIIVFLFLSLSWTHGFSQKYFIISDGNLNITGAVDIVLNNTQFINNGSFSDNAGTVHVIGNASDAQSALGGDSTTVFYNLTINKTSNGTQLTQIIRMHNELLMTSGNIDLNGFDLSLGETNGMIMGESGSSYVHGATGGEVIITVDLNAPSSANPGNLGASITSTADLGSTTISRGHMEQDVNGQVSILRYYDIVPANNSGLDATVRFSYLDEEVNTNVETDLAPFRFNGSTWDENVVNDSDVSANYVETAGVDAFSLWTLAESSALPVELVYFRAEATKDEQVLLQWETATEINNDYFIVERSSNGFQFEYLQEVLGAGNSFQLTKYVSYDKKPLSGINYYRLKQVDYDGSFEYSNIQVVEFGQIVRQISVYPNPTYGVLKFNRELTGRIIVYNAFGQVVWQKFDAGTLRDLDLSFLSTGTYVLKNVDVEGHLNVAKIVVSKN